MKKIAFTSKGQSLFDITNQIIIDDEDADYHKLSSEQKLILDFGMYIEGGYGDNSFENIEDFALIIGGEEYQDAAKGVKKIITKINKGIKQGLIEIN